MTGFENLSSVFWVGHMFVFPFGMDIGAAFSILSVLVFIQQIEKEQIDYKLLVLLIVFFIVTVGSKGTCAVVIMGGMGCVCLFWLFQKNIKKAIMYGCSLLISFSVIFFAVISPGFSVFKYGQGLKVGGGLSVVEYPIMHSMLPIIGDGGYSFAEYVLLVGCWIICVQPCLTVAAVIVTVKNLHEKRRMTCVDMCLISIAFFGFALNLITKQSGTSEMYFSMITFPFIAVFVSRWISQYDYKGILGKCFVVILFILSIGGSLLFYKSITPSFGEGYKNIFTHGEELDITIPKSLRYDEYEAYEWIRKNTLESDVLVTNLVLLDSAGNNYSTGAIAERYLWLDNLWFMEAYGFEKEAQERKQILQKFYNNDTAAKEYLEQEGVTYVIEIKKITELLEYEFDMDNKVFENESVNVFKVTEHI